MKIMNASSFSFLLAWQYQRYFHGNIKAWQYQGFHGNIKALPWQYQTSMAMPRLLPLHYHGHFHQPVSRQPTAAVVQAAIIIIFQLFAQYPFHSKKQNKTLKKANIKKTKNSSYTT